MIKTKLYKNISCIAIVAFESQVAHNNTASV